MVEYQHENKRLYPRNSLDLSGLDFLKDMLFYSTEIFDEYKDKLILTSLLHKHPNSKSITTAYDIKSGKFEELEQLRTTFGFGSGRKIMLADGKLFVFNQISGHLVGIEYELEIKRRLSISSSTERR